MKPDADHRSAGAAEARGPGDSGVNFERLLTGRAGSVIALIWGWAEATWFFFVPDVFLSLLACARLGTALRASIASLAGALIGGTMMFAFGSRAPDAARSFLDLVPGIRPELIDAVRSQFDTHGITALLFGPQGGIPYKVYAVEWGARHGDLVTFLLVSVPARYARFVLSVLVARGIAAIVRRPGRRFRIVVILWAVIWSAFYVVYFVRMRAMTPA